MKTQAIQLWLQDHAPTLAASRGVIPGVSIVDQFGRNQDIDTATVPESVWEGGGLYPFQDSSFQLEIVSDSVADASAGTGTRTVRLEGLDNSFETIEEIVTLNGTSAVATASSNWRRLQKITSVTAGSNGSNVGALTARLQGGGTTLASIPASQGQSTLGIYTVPAGKIAELHSVNLEVGKGPSTSEMELGIFTRDASSSSPAWNMVSLLSGRANGSSSVINRPEIILGPMTDIDFRVIECDQNNTSASLTFQLILVDQLLV